MSARYTEGAV